MCGFLFDHRSTRNFFAFHPTFPGKESGNRRASDRRRTAPRKCRPALNAGSGRNSSAAFQMCEHLSCEEVGIPEGRKVTRTG
jgi:hypothetical protein